ncbi:MAG: hypothetical protein B7Z58_01755 [Acidiphilium sp. 37-64-53]|uniref:DUF1223 domain-containing protein n=1 Tax=Acidiphilium TaxID=522 RepID=UPI000BD2370D|nr:MULTISPECIES: DUF1223 domain-containing protein [Acidiphilium]OYW03921.1 MAG: hypothetical protein B7Z58_01755 [Acidiphilium sp. 37-64-53]OZB23276.1 MAG: hypothetical protein B7X49_16185 [Acidiphilium sp. 34-64-41]HQT83853.1 DUF1223 domain-containing protein [Acidiphilium rubrum]
MRLPRALLAIAAAAAFGALAAAASGAARPVVVELYTSQSCSDCPPAEALMARLQAADPAILVLTEHVGYFDGPRWTDRFALAAATARQKWYAALHGAHGIYTPQAIIDGRSVAVGSDRPAVTAAIAKDLARAAHPAVHIAIHRLSTGWDLSITDAMPDHPAQIEVFHYDAADRTAIGGGENRGADLRQIHVVRAITTLGAWTGRTFEHPIAPGSAAHIAVVVQQDDGTILGAAAQ